MRNLINVELCKIHCCIHLRVETFDLQKATSLLLLVSIYFSPIKRNLTFDSFFREVIYFTSNALAFFCLHESELSRYMQLLSLILFRLFSITQPHCSTLKHEKHSCRLCRSSDNFIFLKLRFLQFHRDLYLLSCCTMLWLNPFKAQKTSQAFTCCLTNSRV